MEKIKFFSQDGINLVGNYYPAKSEKSVLLLHMYKRSKEDWEEFAQELNAAGYQTLAMDLRGHGESGGNIEKISSENFDPIILSDVGVAVNFLKQKGAKDILIIGASIGANAALIYGAQNKVSGLILLSPGVDYHGINIEEALKNYSGPLFLAASEDDSYSYESVSSIYNNLPVPNSQKKLILYKNAGHGMRMFGKEKPDLAQSILKWLSEIK